MAMKMYLYFYPKLVFVLVATLGNHRMRVHQVAKEWRGKDPFLGLETIKVNTVRRLERKEAKANFRLRRGDIWDPKLGKRGLFRPLVNLLISSNRYSTATKVMSVR